MDGREEVVGLTMLKKDATIGWMTALRVRG